jgi:hypothetical protein
MTATTRNKTMAMTCGNAFFRKEDFIIIGGIIPGKIMVFCPEIQIFGKYAGVKTPCAGGVYL